MTDLSLSAPHPPRAARRGPSRCGCRCARAGLHRRAGRLPCPLSPAARPTEASSAQTGGEKATEGAPTAEAGVLMVASALDSEPYEQATSTSQIGFTVELLRLVGERAGLDVQFARAVNHKDADQNITPAAPGRRREGGRGRGRPGRVVHSRRMPRSRAWRFRAPPACRLRRGHEDGHRPRRPGQHPG
ncbi:MAG: hypothetical protein ACLTDR_15195 [Adlercreutzia equolifaciens]